MRIVDLFCGAGGFSRGAHEAGFDVAAAYDRDPILTSSFQANFPDTKLHIRNVAWLSAERVRRDAGGPIAGVIGGPPCQGFSEIGKRRPSDPRRSLLRHFFRIVAEINPDFFVMENVRGLGFADARPSLDAAMKPVMREFDVFGPNIWDAASFGAATTRPRLFVIGVRKILGKPVRQQDIEAYFAPAVTVGDAIADLVSSTNAGEVDGFDHWLTNDHRTISSYAQRLRNGGSFTGHRVTVHAKAVSDRFEALSPGEIDKIGRHKRLSWSGRCPTLRAGTGSDKGSFQSVRPIHPDEPRVITVREAARLQGFPDEHRFHRTVWHSFRMIGNSVSPIVGAAVLGAVRDRVYGASMTDSVGSKAIPTYATRI